MTSDDLSFDLNAPASNMLHSSMTSGATVDMGDSDTSGNYSGYYWPWFEPYREYCHYYHYPIPSGNDFEKAFKIARALVEKKVVTAKYQKTIGDFFKLMDIVQKAL